MGLFLDGRAEPEKGLRRGWVKARVIGKGEGDGEE